jgi:hypothetical protein
MVGDKSRKEMNKYGGSPDAQGRCGNLEIMNKRFAMLTSIEPIS